MEKESYRPRSLVKRKRTDFRTRLKNRLRYKKNKFKIRMYNKRYRERNKMLLKRKSIIKRLRKK